MTRRSPLRLLWAGIWQITGEWGTGRENAMVKALAFTMAFSRPVPHSPAIGRIFTQRRRKGLRLVMFHVKQIS